MDTLDALTADIDSLMADLAIVPPPTSAASVPFGHPSMQAMRASVGPGAYAPGGASFGPGAARASVGGASFGPDGASFGPGAGAPRASVGAAAYGPGGASFGPGAGMSTGPGMRPLGASTSGINNVATHTPDGLAITHSGPPCAFCGEMVIGKVLHALNNTYHMDHFVCVTCSQPFPGDKFIEHEGKPYCEEHYWEVYAPRCFACQQPIREGVIKIVLDRALGRMYHPNHFTCQGCGVGLAGQQFKEAGGEPYCGDCKRAVQIVIEPDVHICAKCKKPIIGEYILLYGQRMHPEHFQCDMCGKDLRNGDCHEYQGKNYCHEDYLKLLTPTCAGCRKPIIARSVTGLGRVWHPEHFCCAHCHAPFAGSEFFEKDGLPYCEEHYKQLFGRPCSKCDLPVTTNGVEALGKTWHREHFMCQNCDVLLDPMGRICSSEGKPLCKKCYLRLPSKMRAQMEKQRMHEAKEAQRLKKEREKEIKRAEAEAKKTAKAAAKAKN